jgi:hypothetical protein
MSDLPSWPGRIRAIVARRPGGSLRALARELDVNEKTVRDWTSGADPVRGTAAVALAAIEAAIVDPPGPTRDCRAALAPHVAELVARAGAAGWRADEIADILFIHAVDLRPMMPPAVWRRALGVPDDAGAPPAQPAAPAGAPAPRPRKSARRP